MTSRVWTRITDAVHGRRTGAAIARSYGERPQSVEDDEQAMANAIALTEVEPWPAPR